MHRASLLTLVALASIAASQANPAPGAPANILFFLVWRVPGAGRMMD